ncbi:cobalamin biosynthesis protein CobD [Cytobacillus firmus]|uniref:adenosylcobinamide-phosphate synthase CbiB n=1 Tax=Cytobacillus firmus TaxID=1399 RepID=UPI00077CB3C7|nr:adenosylcobinamide-phosphate synthase CbiB [Cytobacillus firmus]MBG9544486.1 cobalamin biosynthesis protein CobD [Cytobacillus firmus]MBG9551915.1 cobalamin biosynthesis protein CobD [Cytobacillus firmus]MBG9555221.1 cobalamin biosynthesis protein CobD [Cytobacillus firmus]MBG9573507.1 cobalamin biosynthesis protein CobD [Cytobacillus firmus]MEC1894261.1 adenosylcobinamide-phosphate synthase CbiB [Cytobacillus firmus]
MILYHLFALTFAWLLDKLIGDPPNWPHPVRWMGALIHKLEQALNKGRFRKLKGSLMLLIVLLAAGGITLFITRLFYEIHPIAGILAEGILIFTAIAQKSLKEAALEVYEPLAKGEMEAARVKLSYIVGRDTDLLDEPGIVRAAVETVAENTSDGITAPLFWAMIGGAPLALIYRAINTCDSMVGHMNERYMDFGWASAKVDDIANWIPSRLTSLCIMLTQKPEHSPYEEAWAILFRDAPKHPSPNSGWGEAAVAALLGVQLGGINFYKGVISNRATMGKLLVQLEKEHIIKSISIMNKTVFLFLLLLWTGGMFLDLAFTRI